MHKIQANVVTVVAADTRAVLQATDQALLAHAQMLASVIEGVSGSNLPINISQDLYSRIVAHGGKIIEGREDLRQLITRLKLIKDRSNQRELASGCPNGLPALKEAFFGSADITGEPQFA